MCSELLALSVAVVVAPNASNSCNDEEEGKGGVEASWVHSEVVSVHGIHRWHPAQAAPANVISSAIVLNVHGAKVTSLPPEEFGNVHGLYENRDEHGAIKVTVNVILLETVANDAHLPEHHAEAAVGELLDIPAQDAWVELGAPEEINDEVSVTSRVLGGREVETFESEE